MNQPSQRYHRAKILFLLGIIVFRSNINSVKHDSTMVLTFADCVRLTAMKLIKHKIYKAQINNTIERPYLIHLNKLQRVKFITWEQLEMHRFACIEKYLRVAFRYIVHVWFVKYQWLRDN